MGLSRQENKYISLLNSFLVMFRSLRIFFWNSFIVLVLLSIEENKLKSWSKYGKQFYAISCISVITPMHVWIPFLPSMVYEGLFWAPWRDLFVEIYNQNPFHEIMVCHVMFNLELNPVDVILMCFWRTFFLCEQYLEHWKFSILSHLTRNTNDLLELNVRMVFL